MYTMVERTHQAFVLSFIYSASEHEYLPRTRHYRSKHYGYTREHELGFVLFSCFGRGLQGTIYK